MASRRNVRYTALSTEDGYDTNNSSRDNDDPRFKFSPKSYDRIPWKSIALALFLLALGTLLLFLAFFLLTGHMGGEKTQAYGLLALGFLAFLPGVLKVPHNSTLSFLRELWFIYYWLI